MNNSQHLPFIKSLLLTARADGLDETASFLSGVVAGLEVVENEARKTKAGAIDINSPLTPAERKIINGIADYEFDLADALREAKTDYERCQIAVSKEDAFFQANPNLPFEKTQRITRNTTSLCAEAGYRRWGSSLEKF